MESGSPKKTIQSYLHRIHNLRLNKDIENSVPNAEQISNLYTELNNYVMKLDGKVGGVLKQHEMECLKIYREKMYAVQKEMRALKDRANEEENTKRKELKIKDLEKQRDMIREKAENLDKNCKEQKMSLDKWKLRAEEMLDDKKFYEEQIEVAKKQRDALTEQLKAIEIEKARDLEASVDNYAQAVQKSPGFSQSQSTNPNYFSQISHRLKETIGHMYSQLEAERKNLRSLKNAKTNFLLEKGELEDLFLLCVEDIKREIYTRKIKASRNVAKGKKVMERERNIEFNEFKEIDKRKVMENFLNSTKVRMFLYEKMFGKPVDEPITLEKSENSSKLQRSLIKSRSSSKPSTSNGLLSHIFSKNQVNPESKSLHRPSSVPLGISIKRLIPN